MPRFGSEEASRRGAWRRLGERIERRHRAVWIVTALALGAMALGALTLDDNLTSANGFRGSVEAVKGQQLLQQSFPAGASAPTTVLVPERDAGRTLRSRPRGDRTSWRRSGSRRRGRPARASR